MINEIKRKTKQKHSINEHSTQYKTQRKSDFQDPREDGKDRLQIPEAYSIMEIREAKVKQ